MKIHYLEIVTLDPEASVSLYSKIHAVSFNPADELLGGENRETIKRWNSGD